jgi:hypothetical protein
VLSCDSERVFMMVSLIDVARSISALDGFSVLFVISRCA